MDFQGFEKISTNCEIMLRIYKMLNFTEQLSVACINGTLEFIFKEFVWKLKYRTLKIFGNSRYYIVTNETNVNRQGLPPALLQEFLRMYAEDVEELDVTPYLEIDLKQFKNLTSLTYYCIENSVEKLKILSQTVPQLQSLSLYLSAVCKSTSIILGECEPMDITRFCPTETLLEMKQLRKLSLESWNTFIKYDSFRKLVKGLQLEVLKLDSCVLPAQKNDELEPRSASHRHSGQLKELDIEAEFHPPRWDYNFSAFFRNFENLVILNVKMSYNATDNTLNMISGICRNLRQLSFQHTTFVEIRRFCLPPKVTELSLLHCQGLRHANLKYLLTDSDITTFISKGTIYVGIYEELEISHRIHTLDLDTMYIPLFRYIPNGYNRNLKNLKWNYPNRFSSHQPPLVGIPIASCIHLETLSTVRCLFSLNALLQLRHLQKLDIPCSSLPPAWNYIEGLLRLHPSLRELSINEFTSIPWDFQGVETKNITTTVTILKIPLAMFKEAPEFWSNLFEHNTNMTITLTDVNRAEMKEKTPTHLNICKCVFKYSKTIDVFGFTLSFFEMDRNFNGLVAPLLNDGYHPLVRIENEDMRNIILSRKKK